MVKPINGGSIRSQTGSRGFSLIEMMITIAMTGFVIGIVSLNMGGLTRIANKFNEQAAFKEQYLIN